MIYHNRRKWYCGYCLSSQAETKQVSGTRSFRILRRKREGNANLVVSLETIRTVALLWQRLALSNGTIGAISSFALSIWIYCQKSLSTNVIYIRNWITYVWLNLFLILGQNIIGRKCRWVGETNHYWLPADRFRNREKYVIITSGV
jgi:hypothetical protein